MPDVTKFASDIKTAAHQKDGFHLTITPAQGVSLVGAVVTCQIRRMLNSGPAMVTPMIASSLVSSNLEVDFTWTQDQSDAFGIASAPQRFVIEVDLAFADDPTHPSLRFVGTLVVAPGGNV
jgi:hypothetical protein